MEHQERTGSQFICNQNVLLTVVFEIDNIVVAFHQDDLKFGELASL